MLNINLRLFRNFKLKHALGNICFKSTFKNAAITEQEFQSNLFQHVEYPDNAKVIKVSLLGMPNAGKSTLINSFMERNIMATSSKIDTTVTNTAGVLTIDETQMIFYDTPGIHNTKKRRRLRVGTKASAPSQCFGESDLGLVIADLSSLRNKQGFLHPELLFALVKHRNVPTVLVLNKEDQLQDKTKVLQLIYLMTAGKVNGQSFAPTSEKTTPLRIPKISTAALDETMEIDDLLHDTDMPSINKLRKCRGWPYFQDVFVVSAMSKLNIDPLLRYIQSYAKPGPWEFNKDLSMNVGPQQCAIDFVRAEMLELLPNEVPYSIDVFVTKWEIINGTIFMDIVFKPHKKKHCGLISKKVKTIIQSAQSKLHDIFFCEISITGMIK